MQKYFYTLLVLLCSVSINTFAQTSNEDEYIFRQSYRGFLNVKDAYTNEKFRQEIINSGQSPENYAWTEYKSAIEKLYFLVTQNRSYEQIYIKFPAETELPPPGNTPHDGDITLTLKRSIELVAQDYAPWGVEVIYSILQKIYSYTPLFDLRILTPIGNGFLPFVDISVPVDYLPANIKTDETYKKEISEFSKGKFSETFTLRLFADTTVNKSWDHLLLQRTDDTFLRWGPVLYGGAKYYLTGVGSLALLGIEAAWSVTEATLDYYQDYADADSVTITRNQYLTTDIGDGTGLVADAYIALAGGKVSVNGKKFTAGAEELHVGIGRLALSASIAYGLEKYQDGYLKEIGNIPTGRYGYYNSYVPPILLIGYIEGEKNKTQIDEYRKIQIRTLGWNLNYEKIYSGNLNDSIGAPSGVNWDFQNFPFDSYRSNKKWPNKIIQDPSPDSQFIRFAISKTIIEKQIKLTGSNSTWDKVDLSGLGLTVRVSTAEGYQDENLQDVTQPSDITKGLRYASIRRHNKGTWSVPSEFAQCPKEYAVQSLQINGTREHYVLQIINNKSNDPTLSSVAKKVSLSVQNKSVLKREGEFNGPTGEKFKQSWFLTDIGEIPFIDQLRLPEEMGIEFDIFYQFQVIGSKYNSGIYQDHFKTGNNYLRLSKVSAYEFKYEENQEGMKRTYYIILNKDYLSVASFTVQTIIDTPQKKTNTIYEMNNIPIRLLYGITKSGPVMSVYFAKNGKLFFSKCGGDSWYIETYYDSEQQKYIENPVRVKIDKCLPVGSTAAVSTLSVKESELERQMKAGELDPNEVQKTYEIIQNELIKMRDEED